MTSPSLRRSLILVLLASLAVVAPSAPASAEPTWLPQVDATAAHTYAQGAVMALDDTGRVTVVTAALDITADRVLDGVTVATRDPGAAGYGPEQTLTPVAGSRPSIGSNPAGLTAVAFQDYWLGIRVAVRAPGDALFHPPLTVSRGDGDVYGSQVVVSTAGAVTALWQWYDADADVGSVQFATLAPGSSTWSDPADLFTPVPGRGDRLGAGIDAAGVITAAWEFADHVWVATSRPAGGWGDPVDLTPTMSARNPKSAVGEDGTVAIGWVGGSWPELTPWLAVREPGGGFVATAVEEAPSGSSSAPDPAVSADGVVAAAWTYAAEASTEHIRTTGAVIGGVPQTAATVYAPSDPVLGSGPDGALTVVWRQPAVKGSSVIAAVHRPVGGGWGDLVSVTPDVESAEEQDPVVAVDRFGDATVAFRDYDATLPASREERTGTVTLDVAGPRISWTASGPSTAGAALGLSVATTDWSAPVSVEWSFGDGATSTGAATSHVYDAAGTYQVTVTATDAVGNTSTGSRSVVVGAPPPPLPPGSVPDRVAPVLAKAAIKPKVLPATRPANLRVTSSEAARVTGVVQRKVGGRWKRVASRKWSAVAGANREKLYGKAAQSRLRPGKYRVRLTAVDSTGNISATTTTGFRVDRG